MGLLDSIFGGSKSSTQASKVWDQQAPFLQGLYQRAYNASLGMGTGGPQVYGPQPKGAKGRVNTQPAPGQPGQMGGGYDPLQALGGSLTNQGQGFLGQLGMFGQAGNPFAQAQVGQLGNSLGRLFQQQIAPAIQSQFAGAGQLGGDRQALALGQAGEGLGQAFTGGALDIYGNSANMALQANQAGLGGLGAVGGAGNLGMFGSLGGLADLIGAPTVLGGASSARGPGLFGQFFGGG